MGLIEDLGTYLDTSSTRWTLGTNLFLNVMPHEPNTAAALVETAGSPPQHTLAPSTKPKWENHSFQAAFRSTSSTRARTDAQTAWDLLDDVANTALSGTTYMRVSLRQSPFLLRRDEQDRVIFVFNGDAMRRR